MVKLTIGSIAPAKRPIRRVIRPLNIHARGPDTQVIQFDSASVLTKAGPDILWDTSLPIHNTTMLPLRVIDGSLPARSLKPQIETGNKTYTNTQTSGADPSTPHQHSCDKDPSLQAVVDPLAKHADEAEIADNARDIADASTDEERSDAGSH